jgi:predicted ATPase
VISKIQIRNFKSIKNLDLELKPINILIGANGVGKSNFISFFKLLNRIYAQRLQEYIGNNIDALLYFGRKSSESLGGIIEFSRENYKNAFYFILKNQAQSNAGFITELGDYFNKGSNNQDFNSSYLNWDKKIWDKNKIESSLLNSDFGRANYLKEYLNEFKIYHFHDTSESSVLKQASELNDNRYLAEDGRNLAAYLYFLQEKHPKSLQKIEMQVRSIAPFFDRFDLAPDRLNEKQIELRWLEKGSDIAFNAHYLSDGTLRFISLITLLLQPELPKVIIIDEPELGLHPVAIYKLANLFQKASAQSQIIISTQSTTLVDHFDPEDIITVDRKNGETYFVRQNKENLAHWLDNYSMGDLWNKNVIGGRL